RGLNDGYKRHVRIRAHRYCGNKVRAVRSRKQTVCNGYGSRTVRRADNAYRDCLVKTEAAQRRQHYREEDTYLTRRAEEEQLGIGKQRSEVHHRAYTYKQYKRENFTRIKTRSFQNVQNTERAVLPVERARK